MIERVGIIGGGQLGRMLVEAANPLGFRSICLDPTEHCPTSLVGSKQIQAELDDTGAIRRLADQSDVLTWEIEHIPAEYLMELIDNGYNVQPNPETLKTIQDKLAQKQFLSAHGIPVGEFSDDPSAFQGSYIIKTRFGGYDGRGNLVVDRANPPSAEQIKQRFGDTPLYFEKMVDLQKELAVIAARDMNGQISVYPVLETIQENNICHMVLAPAGVDPKVEQQANEIAVETMRLLNGSGVFAIEMFLDGNNNVLLNEIAPRVHNSGHLTIEGCQTSQFEQHIRAITGLPLGKTALRAPAVAMINILGTNSEPMQREGMDRVLSLPDTHVHYYGKNPSRPERKLGHITVLGENREGVIKTARRARKELTI
ncbi:MAG: 5-(carboxyamino)imidazole ribonucleotide synthase [Candidatus Nomurabacteria bacterium]|jgi:5-(carboxyamino)imidazole ribonucleotide synthase|nr:5-(carboxyamino)imidazole ribonucleotide synthase [Candidatus Nomurabacteria bacterium]